MKRKLVGLGIVSLLSACNTALTTKPSSANSATSSADETPVKLKPPALRLPTIAKPEKYKLQLTLDPDQDTFEGQLVLDLHLFKSTQLLWLHASELEIQAASLEWDQQTVAVSLAMQTDNKVAFAFEQPIGPGQGSLHVTYIGELGELHETEGLFRRQVDDNSYIISENQPLGARRIFPCFDEPAYKAPIQLSLRTKSRYQALSNMPKESEQDQQDGWVQHHFRTSPPLPTYLFALAVGSFEFVEVTDKPQVRLVVPRGYSSQTNWAVESTPQLLRLVEGYMGTPCPFEKLDLVAMPDISAGMENPGLITFRSDFMLISQNDLTAKRKLSWASIVTHEMIHLWLGDLVTMKWWDDLWINEALATWLTAKLMRKWRPEWTPAIYAEQRFRAMDEDSLTSARSVRQPIENEGDIYTAFDGISYQKGAQVTRMFEKWVGEDQFQKAIRAFIQQYAWRNVSASDFFAVLSKIAGRDLGPSLSTFLDQSGIPLVSVDLVCAPQSKPKLVLMQSRYLPLGSPAVKKTRWQIPVCVKYPAAKDLITRDCTLMTNPISELILHKANNCPNWIIPNTGQTGYYRFELTQSLLQGLLKNSKKLSIEEQQALIGNTQALLLSGHMLADQAYRLVSALAKNSETTVIEKSIDFFLDLEPFLVTPALREKYQQLLHTLYYPWAQKLGWQDKPEESTQLQMLRPKVLKVTAIHAGDKELLTQGYELALKWLKNRDQDSITVDVMQVALSAAAQQGDVNTYIDMLNAAQTTTDESEQNNLFWKLGEFTNPSIAKQARNLVLSDDLNIYKSRLILIRQLEQPETRQAAYAFCKQNIKTIMEKLPKLSRQYFPYHVARSFCDPKSRQDVANFFQPISKNLPGGMRILNQTLERIDICTALRSKQLPSIQKFFQDKTH